MRVALSLMGTLRFAHPTGCGDTGIVGFNGKPCREINPPVYDAECRMGKGKPYPIEWFWTGPVPIMGCDGHHAGKWCVVLNAC